MKSVDGNQVQMRKIFGIRGEKCIVRYMNK